MTAGYEAHVVVGAGLAGASAAGALRDNGFTGPVVLVGDEPEPPYQRPPLSKGYLQGKAPREAAYVHPPEWYAANGVELRLGDPAIRLDRDAHEVVLAGGDHLGYAKLLLATGSAPRPLPVPGAEKDGVHVLRTLPDSDALKSVLVAAQRIAIVGAGWIGLETAAAAREAGVEVVVLEQARLPLLQVLGPEVAAVFADLHRRHGVDLRLGVEVAEVTSRGGRATGIRLADGTQVDADAVVVGTGVTPNVALARDAGLDIDDGITVDDRLCTVDPDVFAAGDVANAYHPLLGRHLRVEHWANALHQPAAAAAAMLGLGETYRRLPYFYTDQYELGMEYTGHVEPGGYDEVVFRGDPASLQFLAFWVKDGRVRAGMNVNVWDVTGTIEGLIARTEPVDRAGLADPARPLESLI